MVIQNTMDIRIATIFLIFGIFIISKNELHAVPLGAKTDISVNTFYTNINSSCPAAASIQNITDLFNKQPIVDACYKTNLSQIYLNETINKENANDLLCVLYFHSFSTFCEKMQNNNLDLKTQILIPKLDNDEVVQICNNIANATIFKNNRNRCLEYCLKDSDVLPQCALMDYYVNYAFNTVSNLQEGTVVNSLSNKNANNLVNNISASDATIENKFSNDVSSPSPSSVEQHSSPTKLSQTSNQKNKESIDSNREPDSVNQIPNLTGKSAKVVELKGVTNPEQNVETHEQHKAPTSINTGQSVDQKVLEGQEPNEQAIKPELENTLNEDVGQDRKAANVGDNQNEQTLDDGDDDNDFANREMDDNEDYSAKKQSDTVKPLNKIEKPGITEGESDVAINNSSIDDIDGESYFFSYFMVVCVLFVLGYVFYHNRTKVMALVLEGKRSKKQYRGRRPNSANYHKLDSNLEEAISSSCTKNSSNIIY